MEIRVKAKPATVKGLRLVCASFFILTSPEASAKLRRFVFLGFFLLLGRS